MDMLSKPVLLLALAILLAIGTERLLELIRALIEHVEALRPGSMDRWQKKAEALRNRIEFRLNNAGASDSSVFRAVLSLACRYLSPPTPESGELIAIHVKELRKMSLRVRCKVIGIVIGIGVAFLFQLDIFALVKESASPDVNTGVEAAATEEARAAFNKAWKAAISFPFELPAWLGMIISGVAMGLGAGPVHKMISALERARRTRME